MTEHCVRCGAEVVNSGSALPLCEDCEDQGRNIMETVYNTPPCPGCGSRTAITVDEHKLRLWQHGELIQNVWPEKTPAERETMITGFHDECFETFVAQVEAEEA